MDQDDIQETRVRASDKHFIPLFWLGLLFSIVFWLLADKPLKTLGIISLWFPIVLLPMALLEKHLRDRPQSLMKKILYPISHTVFLLVTRFQLLLFGFAIGLIVFGFTFFLGHAIYLAHHQHIRNIH